MLGLGEDKMIEWTSDELAKRTEEEVRTLRDNAIKKGAYEVAKICDGDLARRSAFNKAGGRYVVGFHFKCADGLNLRLNQDGTFWTGSWAVAAEHAVLAPYVGAYLALHENKSAMSYVHGNIIGSKLAPRAVEAKTDVGIDFLVRSTGEPMSWVGEGTGERGYKWFTNNNRVTHPSAS
jgi:hypothetical protein